MGSLGALKETPATTTKTAAPTLKKKEEDVTVAYLKDHFLKGIPAVPGIRMGRLKIVRHQYARRHEIHDKQSVKIEIERLKEAFSYVTAEIQETKKKAEAKFD